MRAIVATAAVMAATDVGIQTRRRLMPLFTEDCLDARLAELQAEMPETPADLAA